MGSDKARAMVGGASLLERAIAAVSSVAKDVRLACGARARYGETGLALVLDERADAGPLAGLEAGLSAAPEGWVVVLAVDMPRADARLLRGLLERARGSGADACLLSSASGREPLCGVYHTRLLASIRVALAAGERRAIAFLDHPAGQGALPRVDWIDERELAFPSPERQLELPVAAPSFNVNTPDDLQAERERLAIEGDRGRP